MPTLGPVKRSALVKYLRKCGFDSPYSGGNHPFMVKGDLTLTIPNPHQKDIGKELCVKESSLGTEKKEDQYCLLALQAINITI